MPPGIPVATVAVNGAKNAGILAASILAVSDEALQARLQEFKDMQKEEVLAKAHSLEELGYEEYLKDK
jgi:5-(carboxyamino)imidazole ribonucleotide mutase